MQDFIEFTQPIIAFSHTTAFNLILCGGWFAYYLFVQFSSKRVKKEVEQLRKQVETLKAVEQVGTDE